MPCTGNKSNIYGFQQNVLRSRDNIDIPTFNESSALSSSSPNKSKIVVVQENLSTQSGLSTSQMPSDMYETLVYDW